MKKLFLFLMAIVLTSSIAWSLPDNVQPNEYSGSQQIKSTGGFVYMVSCTYKGVTAGDQIQLLDGTSSGTSRVTCMASSANGMNSVPLTVGAPFNSGIYYKETKTGGNFMTDIQYF